MSRIRVLVVDDSPTMRQLVTRALQADGGIEVAGAAASALEARDLIKQLNPDVMTLDVEMPEMDGLSFLERVMRLRPMPVVMVSTLTAQGTETAISALALGAVDCVVKPSAANPTSFDELPAKVKVAARVKRRVPAAEPEPAPGFRGSYQPGNKVIAIGSSTGGVEALIAVLTRFPANCVPTVVTQHMPPVFTRNLAQRLDRMCAPQVLEATHGAPLKVGTIYVAPGGDMHLEVSAQSCLLKPGGPVNGHCPSVDRLFQSVARSIGPRAVGALLTGMGRDGAQGLLEMRRAGARTFAQDEASSVVYGMPRAAMELGAAEHQYSLTRIGPALVEAAAAKS
ncbi:chemotaxis response regulator protein-glutamate methylesterase [Aestuariivirga litoralis]|uniref:Protein-glutamate methylesterase/protein-glutamine glutaminase n=1 Tax=Aestuariivirga litoralis TaxID=2650924 RepID=A0A2W2BKY6_9HYPH|nr:chemotaxis response regulator protein-glutamate methylesterase [Aestuariivirga litoralis]PZF76567.1 chemotaxis response regulator protein-glutamate methylesterase [Aestuariivirga litoralis]